MSENESATSRRAEQAITLLDRVVQYRWALLIVSVVLAIDDALVIFFNNGIANFDLHLSNVAEGGKLIPTGAYIVFLGCYVFFMGAISPVFQNILEWFMNLIRYSDVWYKIFGHSGSYRDYREKLNSGYVTLYDAKKEALKEKDSFWIGRVEARKDEKRKSDSEGKMLSQLSFSCTFLLLVNLLAGDNSFSSLLLEWNVIQSIIWHWIVDIVFLLAVGVLILPWLIYFMRNDEYFDWIEHPEMAEKKLREMKKKD